MDANEDVTLAFLARRHRRSIKRSIVFDCIGLITGTLMLIFVPEFRFMFGAISLVSALDLIEDMRFLNGFDRMFLIERGQGE